MRGKLVALLLLLQCLLASAQLDAGEAETEGAGGAASDEDASPPELYTEIKGPFAVIQSKSMNLGGMNVTTVNLTCNVGGGGKFYAWAHQDLVFGLSPILSVQLKEARDYGSYFCLALPKTGDGKYKAVQILVTQMPTKNTPVKPRTASADVQLTCGSSSSKWSRYSPTSFVFEPMTGKTGKTVVIPLADLGKNSFGLTYYKCTADDGSENFFRIEPNPLSHETDKGPRLQFTDTARSVTPDLAAVPLLVPPSSQVTFECTKVNPSDMAEWSFRNMNSTGPLDYGALNSGVEIKNTSEASLLKVTECAVKDTGYYRCKIGDSVKYAILGMKVLVPIIVKDVYDMDETPGVNNLILCEVPVGGSKTDITWRIIPPSGTGSVINLTHTDEQGPFKSDFDDAPSQMDVNLRFQDDPDLDGYRVECRLGDMFDSIKLKMKPKDMPPKIKKKYDANEFVQFLCIMHNKTTLSDIKFYQTKKKTANNYEEVETYQQPVPTAFAMLDGENRWFRCSGVTSSGQRLFSEPASLFDNPLMVTIEVDGQVKPENSRMARVAGKPTEILCKFENMDSTKVTNETVKIMYNDVLVAYPAIKVDNNTFKFVLNDTSGTKSGRYACKNTAEPDRYKVVSDEVVLNWCSPGQFVCDGSCHNNSIKCNGIKECKDGSDEKPAMCNPCEPNEVPCDTWNGKKPERTCVLKHWLCDATDDCGNKYDEGSPVAKAWCAASCVNNPTLGCAANETCCSTANKCILRAYECDQDNDCPGNSDESETCCKLRVTDPPKSSIRNVTEGTRVTLECTAIGFERPTINWRCNWGPLREPSRMQEKNVVQSRQADGQYVVKGYLTINNYTKEDNCIYNCEAITKCKAELSPEITLQVVR